MSLVDVDSWLTEYEACERLNNDLLTQLNQRESLQQLSPDYNRLTASIQKGLKQFATELRQLQSKLDVSAQSRTITYEENERRRQQTDTLELQLQQLQKKFTNQSTSRSQLHSSANGIESDPSRPFDVEAFKQTRINILEEQNRGLETLSQTLSRQRALATQLEQETENQNEILDNMANIMDRVDASVGIETTNISLINRRDKTCGYWVVIVLLLIANIVAFVL